MEEMPFPFDVNCPNEAELLMKIDILDGGMKASGNLF